MKPYRVQFSDSDIQDLRRRLLATRWPDEIPGAGWQRGVPLAYLQDLAEYWRESFDWRVVEARLNGLPQLITEVDDATIHLLHVRSPEPDAVPLLLTHGWPGSVLEFLDVIGPLTDPRAHGGDPTRAFHVVIPSLPGYGLSGPTRQPGWDVRRIAGAWAQIMQRLGYERYLVQGGDMGAWVSMTLAGLVPERVLGVHVNFLVTAPTGPENLVGLAPPDLERVGRLGAFFEHGSGYMKIQSTRPQTIAYALTDSPVGQLAWIVEKYHEWSACVDRPEEVFDRDYLLATASLYWLTATAGSSAQLYFEIAGQAPAALAPPLPAGVPLAVSVFPADPAPPVRALAERVYPGIVQWREHDRGGHFAAVEQPDLLVRDLRDFALAVTGEASAAVALAGSRP